ncbi:MAG TPA: sialate O-acetylesterase [Candidatus Eisenbergiella intestinipullorum]|nr:sialate O-acetylesterase [Candidatus Eisenbergiella intestinipullorum]
MSAASFSSHTDVPVDLFLFMGQSNMAGRGISCSRFPQKAPGCLPEAGREFRAVSDPGRLYPVSEPFGRQENRPGGIFEPGMKTGSLVTAFINAYFLQTRTPIVGVSASKGGSSILEWQPGSPYLEDAFMRLQAAETYLASAGLPIRHRFVLWCQGETDGDLGTPSAVYEERFRCMLDMLLSHGIERLFLIRIGRFNASSAPAGGPEGAFPDYATIRRAQEQLALTCPKVVMVSRCFAGMRRQGLMKDAFHYYQHAYNLAGEEAGRNAGQYVNRHLSEPDALQ